VCGPISESRDEDWSLVTDCKGQAGIKRLYARKEGIDTRAALPVVFVSSRGREKVKHVQ
jgi:hypothetical protein